MVKKEKYTLGHVGIQRHPELYKKGSSLIPNVQVEEYLWKLAEIFHDGSKQLSDAHFMVVMHYVMCLRGWGDDAIYMWHAWAQMKACESGAKQMILEEKGKAAHQIAKKGKK